MIPKAPEELTLEEVKEQLALYNRLYYKLRREDKNFMDVKRNCAIKYHRRKKLEKMIADGEVEFDETKTYEKKEDTEKEDLIKTKPRKYSSNKYILISSE